MTALSWGNLWTPPGQDVKKARELASPVTHVSKKMTPLLALHSDNDQSVPINNALLMVEALKKAEALFDFCRYPAMGHMGINDEVVDRALEFIKMH